MEESQSKTPSWRPEGTTAAAASQSGPKWRQEGGVPVHRSHAARRALRIVGTLTLFTISCGMLVWVSTWLQFPHRTSIVLIGAAYENNLAIDPNVYGWKGLGDLAAQGESRWRFFGQRRELLHIAIGPKRLRTDDDWSKGIEAITDANLMVVLTAQGGADPDGPFVLPDDATTSNDSKNRLRLALVLEQLGKQPASQNKILVLDCSHMDANWQLGMLSNEFSRQVAALEPQIRAIPNLIVIIAAGKDQRSWVSEEWRQSSFMHYFIRGLRGAADQNNDTQVDANELFRYTADRVEQWAWSNRVAMQTPLLLPQGEEGVQRSQQIRLNTTSSAETQEDAATIAAYTPPDSLKQAWIHCQQLAQTDPAPSVNAPWLWRRYLDVLLRYDALVRAGADAAWEQVLLAQLAEIEQAILARRSIDLLSVQNTLSMPVLTGSPSTSTATVPPMFQALWGAEPKDYAAIWAKMNTNPAESASLRMRCFDLIFRRAAEAPTTNLAKACDLARVIADPVNPMPAEIHTLLMYNRYMPGLSPTVSAAGNSGAMPGQVAELVQKSLQVSRLADAVSLADFGSGFTYSAWVTPWLRPLVEQGDQNRLQAQDLLFVGDMESLHLASNKLDQAKQVYERAQQEGVILQHALAIRDQVLPMLPYYCRWVAGMRSGLETPPNAQANEPFIKLAEQLCRDTYQLMHRLTPPSPNPSSPKDGSSQNNALRDLADLATRVDAEYSDLKSRFLEIWNQNADVNLPSLWSDAENALRVPYLDPDMRMALITHSRRISRKFLLESTEETRSVPSITVEQNRSKAQARGAREGHMAMAILGKDWFNSAPGKGMENFEQVQYRLATFAVEDNWWQSLETAGREIAVRFAGLAPQIQQLMIKSSTASEADARSALNQTAELAHILPGDLDLDASATPVQNLRKLLVTDSLIWQAQRTLSDHWYSEDPTILPYYRVAGLLYVDDALIQAPASWIHDLITKTSNQLTQSGALVFAGPASMNLTSEQGFSLEYRLQAEQGAYVPNGFPAVWVTAGSDLVLEFPVPGTRIRREIGPQLNASAISCSVSSPLVASYETDPPPLPSTATTTVTANAFFRGQPVALATNVRLDTVPTILVHQLAPPPLASVAVQSARGIDSQYGTSQGAVTIVLDASGSMGAAPGQPFDASTKFAEATNALQNTLSKLPRGTTVSIWVFGEAVGPDKTATDPSRTVRQVIAPTYWDPSNSNQLSQVMSQLTYPTVEPWNQSPIVRSMLYAKDDLTRASGSKTLLVISDGMDNCFANDQELNPNGRSIPTALTEAFGQSSIEVIFVGYKVADAEQERAEDQFKVMTGFQVPGQFLTVDDETDIAGSITGALRQSLRYRVQTLANVPTPGQPPTGLVVSPPGANAQWYPGGLQPGAYNLVLPSDNWVQRTILLNRGDLLLVELLGGASGLSFQRGLYAPQFFPFRPFRQTADWRLSVLQNQSIVPSAMAMLLTLERNPDPNATLLAVQRPREIWFEITPPEDINTPYIQRWNFEYGYPAPAWSLEVPAWPVTPVGQTPAAPTVSVWWSPDQSSQPAAILRQGADFKSYADIQNRNLSIDGNEVLINSVRIEDHVVETAPGKREKMSCMVLRFTTALAADPNGPAMPVILRAQIGGISVTGWEERYFISSQAQALLLWPVGEDEAQGLTELSIFSLESFKKTAARRGFQTTLNNFGAPTPGDVRPQKPVDLR